MTDIVIKRGIGKPDSLLEGELAIDTSTGMLYSLVGGVVAELNEPPEGVDLSNYIDSTKRNDVVEGTFQILWDDSSDATYPFNGRIGYNKNSGDPNSLDGSFLYASGTRGTFSIGRDGDVELHGPSEIQGIPDRDDERPWITGFSYVQAADFLDADGNSIVGSGGGVQIGDEPQDPQEGDQWLETPADGDAKMWVWDGEKWLQQPGSGGSGGGSLWTDNGDGSISYGGTATVSGDLMAAKPDAGGGAIAIGAAAGETTQGGFALALGNAAGYTNQGISAVAVGHDAGKTNQSQYAVALGSLAGKDTQGEYSVSVGRRAGELTQGSDAVAIGVLSGVESQGVAAVAVGNSAGQTTQGASSVAVGREAGKTTQGAQAVAIGYGAGSSNQSSEATAIGYFAGSETQGGEAIAVGYLAGFSNQGRSSIAIGNRAGQADQGDYSIIINSQGSVRNQTVANVIDIVSPKGSLTFNGSNQWTFYGGNVVGPGLRFQSIIQDGSPVIDAKGLIETLSTLRNATKDETIDVRQALASACEKLIEKFEAMQSAATQEIES